MMRKAGIAWKPYAALVVLALVLRLGVIAATPGYEPRLDAAHYDGLACLLVHGEGYRLRVPAGSSESSCGRMPTGENPATAFRPPGWPLVLAGVTAVSEEHRWAAGRVLQAVIGTVAVALIGLAAFLLLGPPGALAALALAAVDTTLLAVGGSLMSEPLFVALISAALCAVLLARPAAASTGRPPSSPGADAETRNYSGEVHPHGPGPPSSPGADAETRNYSGEVHPHPRVGWLVAAGVLLGLAALVRSNGPVLIPALALLAAPSWRRALRPLLVMLAACLLTIAPWTVRNAIQMDAFVPVASYVGTGLAGTFNEQARKRTDFPGAWVSPRRVPAFRDIHLSRRSEVSKQRELRRRALDYAREHPWYAVEAAARNALRILSLHDLSWHRGNAQALSLPRWVGPAAAAGFWVLLALVLASALTGARRHVPAALWLAPLLLIGSAVLAGGEMRYRAGLIPFAVLVAAALATSRSGASSAPACAPSPASRSAA